MFSQQYLQNIANKNRSFSKKIFFYILVPIVIIFAAAFMIYNSYKNVFQTQLENNYLRNLSTLSETVDNSLIELQNTTLLLSSDNNLYDIFYSANKLKPEDGYKITFMTNTLLKFRTTKALIDSVYILNKNMDEVFDISGTYSSKDFFTKNFKYNKYNTNFWDSFRVSTNFYEVLNPSLLESTTADSNYSRTVIPFVTSNIQGFKSNSLLVINISTSELSQLLEKYKLISSSKMCIINHSGTLFSTTDSSITESITKNKDFLNNTLKKKGIFEYNLNGTKTLVISYASNSSQFNDFVYVAFIPFNDFYHQLVSIQIFAYFVLFAGALIAIIAAYFASRKIYTPINNLVEILSNDEASLSNNINEVDYLNNQIRKIMTNETNLKKNLSIVMPLASEQYLIKILTNSYSLLDDDVKNFVYDNNFDFKYPGFCATIIELNFTEKYFNSFTNYEYLELRKRISKMFGNIALENYTTYALSLNHNTLCILINVPLEENLDNIKLNVRNVLTLFDYDKDLLTISAGIGRIYANFVGMNQSYTEAQKALATISPLSSEKLKVYTEININYNFQYSINDENKLFNYLIGNYRDETQAFLNILLEKNYHNNPSEENIKKLYLSIYNTIIRVLNEKKLNITELMGDEYVDIENNLDVLSINDINRYIFLSVNNILSLSTTNSNKLDIVKITEYIKEHFTEDLYLEKVASNFNTSDKYLSRLFKEALGMGFHEYLNSLRISKSKSLLLETDLSVTKIGELAGFTTHSTFFRMFKKYEGINPSEYRENHKKND